MKSLSVLVLSLLSACMQTPATPDPGTSGGKADGYGNDVDAGAPETASQGKLRYATQFCAVSFTCKDSFSGAPGATFDDVFTTNETDCVASFLPPPAMLAALDRSVAAGRIAYSSSDMSACVEGMAQLTCPQWWGTDPSGMMPETCATAIHGTVPVGGACTFTDEPTPHDVHDCADHNRCDLATRTCLAPPAS
jgi:hypothetical protein